jgi:hypothetical protein
MVRGEEWKKGAIRFEQTTVSVHDNLSSWVESLRFTFAREWG